MPNKSQWSHKQRCLQNMMTVALVGKRKWVHVYRGGVKCYKCNNVRLSDIDSCTQTETCPSTQRCAYIYSSGSVRMGCMEGDICELLMASDLVGKRELKSTSSCCNTDYCNGPPQTTTQKTTTLAPTTPSQLCADTNPLFCGNVQLHNTICSDEKLATQFCMNTCGRCPGSHHSVATVTKYTTSMPTVSMTTPTAITTTTNTINFKTTSSKSTANTRTPTTTPSKSTTTTTAKPVPSTRKPTTTISSTTPTTTTKPTTTITSTSPTTTITKPISSTTKPTTTISSTTPTTTTTTLVTTTPFCEDTAGLHCYDPEINSIVCSDTQLQSMCSKTCKIC